MTTTFDLDTFMRNAAREDALTWMDETIAVHERAIRELKRRREAFIEAFDTDGEGRIMKPVDHIGAFLNDVQNGVLRNVRFDRAADIGAKVAAAKKDRT
jgi:hypothetical protein